MQRPLQRAVRLMTFAPGHFHATLPYQHRSRGIHPRVHVYGPLDGDLLAYLSRIAAFNLRADDPTDWEIDVRTGADPLARMLREQPGNAVVIAGRNRPKADAILEAARAGLHVLADKPWVIDAADLPKIEAAFREADLREVALWDMMTERFEVTTVLQRELMRTPAVYGTQVAGTADEPGLALESVHHLKKLVAGVALRRPVWWFNPREAGHALADVGSHLADLAFWLLFPDKPLEYARDVQLLDARCWPTPLSGKQFAALTGLPGAPPVLADVVANGRLMYAGNGTATFTVRGVHVRMTVLWDFASAEGTGDTHNAVSRGSKATVAIHPAADGPPELTVTPTVSTDRAEIAAALRTLCEKWETDYPGVAVKEREADLLIDIPTAVRTTHEDHFANVLGEFVRYFHQPRQIPAWETPNLLAKYALTTAAVQLAVQKQQVPG